MRGANGRELFYRVGDQLMVVPVRPGDTWSAGTPERLFEAPFVADNSTGGGGNANYAVSSDGQQFIFVERDQEVLETITVVKNWSQELLQRVPLP